MVSFRSLEHNTRDGSADLTALAKWRILNRLHDRNETLYYKVLIDHIEAFAPIIYTPTVGLVCQNYGGLFRRPRGMYFSAKDKGEMMSMIYNWPSEQVDMIVVTDGSRILGLGDLGVQGVAIPIGKLDMYVAAAGINPQRILPVMLDVGTNNAKLLNNNLYLGLRQPRLEGDEYLSVLDEFMEAVFTRWPKVIVQFEDFQTKWAFKLLQRYRKSFRMFNDDVQGTAGVALAGLLGAVRAQGRPITDFVKQKIVVVGAGSAGIGVLNTAEQAMSRMLGSNSSSSASCQFWLLDKSGLITHARKDLDPEAAPFARGFGPGEIEGLHEGASLVEVVKKVKPHVLLGLSGVGGIFSQEVLEAMRESESPRPAIFAMSNPTENAECTAAEAFKYAGENIVFASGSPFQDVDLGNGKIGHSNQGNNMYLFPGIGLGTLLSGAHIVSDRMLQAAAECLAEYMTDAEIQRGVIFPSISSIRNITKRVAAAVVRAAVAEDLADGYRETGPKELRQMSLEETVKHVGDNMWFPEYSPLVLEK
jgi:malate dehydrogenase (decarboxylating)